LATNCKAERVSLHNFIELGSISFEAMLFEPLTN